jgi:hypothetical protein
MFIQTEATPNPATLKFLPGQPVMQSGSADFPSRDGSEASPLASRLFEVEGVTGVFLGPDFVTVTKGDVDWAHIKPALLGAIMEHFASGAAVMKGDSHAVTHAEHDGPDAEVVGQIKELLDTRVRPAVGQDKAYPVVPGSHALLTSTGLAAELGSAGIALESTK